MIKNNDFDFEQFHEKLNKALADEDEYNESLKKKKLEEEKRIKRWRTAGIWSAFHSLWCFICGLWEIAVYVNEEDLLVNAHVGGDAYNYIINACQATAFWVLSGVFLIAAFGCAYIYFKKRN